jgi:hypothetical protein
VVRQPFQQRQLARIACKSTAGTLTVTAAWSLRVRMQAAAAGRQLQCRRSAEEFFSEHLKVHYDGSARGILWCLWFDRCLCACSVQAQYAQQVVPVQSQVFSLRSTSRRPPPAAAKHAPSPHGRAAAADAHVVAHPQHGVHPLAHGGSMLFRMLVCISGRTAPGRGAGGWL